MVAPALSPPFPLSFDSGAPSPWPVGRSASSPRCVPAPTFTTSQEASGMSGTIADQIRSSAGKVWFDRFDLGGFARFCRERHPAKTAQHVAAETGLPLDSVKKWLAGDAVPGGRALLALLCVYGPDLAHAMLNGAPSWISSAARAECSRRLDAEIAIRQTERSRLDGEAS